MPPKPAVKTHHHSRVHSPLPTKDGLLSCCWLSSGLSGVPACRRFDGRVQICSRCREGYRKIDRHETFHLSCVLYILTDEGQHISASLISNSAPHLKELLRMCGRVIYHTHSCHVVHNLSICSVEGIWGSVVFPIVAINPLKAQAGLCKAHAKQVSTHSKA